MDEADGDSVLLDLDGVDLDRVEALPESAFTAAVRRILTDGARPADEYASFTNST